MAKWAMWDDIELKGIHIQSDNKGYLEKPNGLKISGGEANYNSHGFYRLEITQPIYDEATQVIDQPIWAYVVGDPDPDYITLTWSVRDKTQDELDEDTAAGVMSRELYYFAKWLIDEGIISQTNINNAPQKLRDAYQARSRIETPL